MTTLENRIRIQIATTGDETARACLRAELAAHLARMGRYDAAQAIVTEIRAIPRWNSAKLSSMVLLAEAMIRLEDEFDIGALDRLVRGFAIANAAKIQPVAVEIASWLAHFNFNRSQFVEMRKWLVFCSTHAECVSSSTMARLCLTLADASRYSGDFSASDRWYSRSRSAAVSLGDEAFLAANMYNRAAYGIARLRLDWANGAADSGIIDQSHLEIESASNYSQATRNTAAQSLQCLWLGRLLQLKGQHGGAVSKIEHALSALPEARHSRLKESVLADLAFSLNELGEKSKAVEMLGRIDQEGEQALESDDRVVYLTQLCRLAAAIGVESAGMTFRCRLDTAKATHAVVAKELTAQIEGLDFAEINRQ